MSIASNCLGSDIIHDWREHSRPVSRQKEIAVGATRPRSRSGAIPLDLTVMKWVGPVGDQEDAEAKAKSEVELAWAVFSHLARIPERQLPSHLSKTKCIGIGGHHNSVLPGRVLRSHYPQLDQLWSLSETGLTDLESIATDALMAAASRAHLPGSGRLSFVKPDSRPSGTSLPRLFMEISVDKGDVWSDYSVELDGCLRGVGIALAIVAYMDPDGTRDWSDRGFEIPGSATLRAAFVTHLGREASARSTRVAEFLRQVGLPGVAEEFLATYGSRESASC